MNTRATPWIQHFWRISSPARISALVDTSYAGTFLLRDRSAACRQKAVFGHMISSIAGEQQGQCSASKLSSQGQARYPAAVKRVLYPATPHAAAVLRRANAFEQLRRTSDSSWTAAQGVISQRVAACLATETPHAAHLLQPPPATAIQPTGQPRLPHSVYRRSRAPSNLSQYAHSQLWPPTQQHSLQRLPIKASNAAEHSSSTAAASGSSDAVSQNALMPVAGDADLAADAPSAPSTGSAVDAVSAAVTASMHNSVIQQQHAIAKLSHQAAVAAILPPRRQLSSEFISTHQARRHVVAGSSYLGWDQAQPASRASISSSSSNSNGSRPCKGARGGHSSNNRRVNSSSGGHRGVSTSAAAEEACTQSLQLESQCQFSQPLNKNSSCYSQQAQRISLQQQQGVPMQQHWGDQQQQQWQQQQWQQQQRWPLELLQPPPHGPAQLDVTALVHQEAEAANTNDSRRRSTFTTVLRDQQQQQLLWVSIHQPTGAGSSAAVWLGRCTGTNIMQHGGQFVMNVQQRPDMGLQPAVVVEGLSFTQQRTSSNDSNGHGGLGSSESSNSRVLPSSSTHAAAGGESIGAAGTAACGWYDYLLLVSGDFSAVEHENMFPNGLFHCTEGRSLYDARDAHDIALFVAEPSLSRIKSHMVNLIRYAWGRQYLEGKRYSPDWVQRRLQQRWGTAALALFGADNSAFFASCFRESEVV